jgi:hypothetical protein
MKATLRPSRKPITSPFSTMTCSLCTQAALIPSPVSLAFATRGECSVRLALFRDRAGSREAFWAIGSPARP